MGPPSYMRSVVERNVVMRRIPVQETQANSQAAKKIPRAYFSEFITAKMGMVCHRHVSSPPAPVASWHQTPWGVRQWVTPKAPRDTSAVMLAAAHNNENGHLKQLGCCTDTITTLKLVSLYGKSDSVMPQRQREEAEVYLQSFSNSALGGVVNFTSRPLHHREIAPAYIAQGAGWTSESVWTLRRREIFFVPVGFRIPDCPPLCLVTFTTFNL